MIPSKEFLSYILILKFWIEICNVLEAMVLYICASYVSIRSYYFFLQRYIFVRRFHSHKAISLDTTNCYLLIYFWWHHPKSHYYYNLIFKFWVETCTAGGKKMELMSFSKTVVDVMQEAKVSASKEAEVSQNILWGSCFSGTTRPRLS